MFSFQGFFLQFKIKTVINTDLHKSVKNTKYLKKVENINYFNIWAILHLHLITNETEFWIIEITYKSGIIIKISFIHDKQLDIPE